MLSFKWVARRVRGGRKGSRALSDRTGEGSKRSVLRSSGNEDDPWQKKLRGLLTEEMARDRAHEMPNEMPATNEKHA